MHSSIIYLLAAALCAFQPITSSPLSFSSSLTPLSVASSSALQILPRNNNEVSSTSSDTSGSSDSSSTPLITIKTFSRGFNIDRKAVVACIDQALKAVGRRSSRERVNKSVKPGGLLFPDQFSSPVLLSGYTSGFNFPEDVIWNDVTVVLMLMRTVYSSDIQKDALVVSGLIAQTKFSTFILSIDKALKGSQPYRTLDDSPSVDPAAVS